ncbi:MAG: peptide-methionine (S)-S-oxide reductase MsrA [Patescibacteria group bacterium]
MNSIGQKVYQRVAFGGGCFWCTEAVFLGLKGVVNVTSGYAGGTVPNPTYEQVSTGATGHAEVILVVYDPQIISYEKLLEIFFESHDPTSLNRQGDDIGTQYRSIILFTVPDQRAAAERFVNELADARVYDKPLVTEIAPLEAFYPAEEYHKNYYACHLNEGYSRAVIKPKIEKIRKKYQELLVVKP